MKYQRIILDSKEYLIVDQLENFRIEDSFIHRENKLSSFTGNGEAKKHIGSYNGISGEKISKFFDYGNWGIPYSDPNSSRKTLEGAEMVGAVVSRNCFFEKSNLKQYIIECSVEYKNPTQDYHNTIVNFYDERVEAVGNLNHFERFTIYDASDNWEKPQNRGYIRSDDAIWDFWRKLALPKITMLAVLKIKDIETSNISFYFKLFIDPDFNRLNHPSLVQSAALTYTSRPYSQAQFKREVHLLLPKCPFTGISEERLLVASHIKPSAICVQEGRLDQAADRYNGISLAPTYDRLFDRGLITFTNEGKLICGTELKMNTWLRLQIDPTDTRIYPIKPEGREEYLEYHRNNVFPNLAEVM